MKKLISLFFPVITALIFSFNIFNGASAQSAESIWIESVQNTASVGETITVTVNATSGTPFQGLKFNLQYDSACLKPGKPKSLLSGLTYMDMPQRNTGMVDAIFASTIPLQASGPVAEVSFAVQSACQTSVQMINAGLVAPDASGMPINIQGIALGANKLDFAAAGQVPALTAIPTPAIAAQSGAQEPSPSQGATPAEEPPAQKPQKTSTFFTVLVIILGVSLLVLVFLGLLLFRYISRPAQRNLLATKKDTPSLFIQRGPKAGSVLSLSDLPCRIGSDPVNDIRLEDASIAPDHAIIRTYNAQYVLVDLGSPMGTYLNGKLVLNTTVPLNSGDVLRMGNTLMVFGMS